MPSDEANADSRFPAQLPLGLTLAPGTTFDAYFPGPNHLVGDLLQSMATARGERQVYLHGMTGLGKSHLLQAACRLAGEQGLPAAWLPLRDVVAHGPAALEGLESLALIALDDIDVIAGDAAWEAGVFSLINRIRDVRLASSPRLILAARVAPAALGLQLPDLVSRLTWGPVIRLAPLDEDARREALERRARALGHDPSAAVLDYLVRHDRRDLAGLLARLETLDRASLAAGRRLTVPFVRQFLRG